MLTRKYHSRVALAVQKFCKFPQTRRPDLGPTFAITCNRFTAAHNGRRSQRRSHRISTSRTRRMGSVGILWRKACPGSATSSSCSHLHSHQFLGMGRRRLYRLGRAETWLFARRTCRAAVEIVRELPCRLGGFHCVLVCGDCHFANHRISASHAGKFGENEISVSTNSTGIFFVDRHFPHRRHL